MKARVCRISLAVSLVLVGTRPVLPQNGADIGNIGNRDINGPSTVSFEEEIELGRSLAEDLERNVVLLDAAPVSTLLPTGDGPEPVTLSDDAVVTAYVDHVGQLLVANSDARVPFTFRVIEDTGSNGLALPGGFVYVDTGLVEAAGSEAELASALATLIAHVAARHGVENQAKQSLLSVQSIPLIFVSGTAATQALPFAIPASVFRFSRGAVEEADFLGVQYLYRAGYEPEAAATFLERIAGQSPSAPEPASSVFMTHPAIPDRVERIRRTIADVLPPRDMNVLSTPEFEDIQRRLAARTPTETVP